MKEKPEFFSSTNVKSEIRVKTFIRKIYNSLLAVCESFRHRIKKDEQDAYLSKRCRYNQAFCSQGRGKSNFKKHTQKRIITSCIKHDIVKGSVTYLNEEMLLTLIYTANLGNFSLNTNSYTSMDNLYVLETF